MRGQLRDLIVAADGKQHITVTVSEDFRVQYDELKEDEITVDIKRYRKHRSLDSNAYAWVLIDKIAAIVGSSKETVYREAIRDIGGVSDTVCVLEETAPKLMSGWTRMGIGWQAETMPSKLPGCVNVILYYGSSTYDSRQMTSLIDRLIEEAKELGIETATPEQLARYADAWTQA